MCIIIGRVPWESLIQGVMRQYFLGTPHTVRPTKCLTKEPCVEESVHVLFNETNSLVENDAQDEEYELRLTRKDLLLTQNSMHGTGKSPEGEPSPGANTVEGGQGLDPSGRSIVEPSLEQNHLNSPRTGLETCFETGSRIGPELVSPIVPARVESVSVDPLTSQPWKH